MTALHTGRVPNTAIGRSTRKYSPLAVNPDYQDSPNAALSPNEVVEALKSEQNHSEPKVVLSPEQNKVFARVKEGKNVFFTGSAGT